MYINLIILYFTEYIFEHNREHTSILTQKLLDIVTKSGNKIHEIIVNFSQQSKLSGKCSHATNLLVLNHKNVQTLCFKY